MLLPSDVLAAACAQALQAATDLGISRVQVEVGLDSSYEHFVCSHVLSISRACNGIAHNLAKFAMCWDPGDRHIWASLS